MNKASRKLLGRDYFDLSKDEQELIRKELEADRNELMRQCAERKAERIAERKAAKAKA